MDKVNEFLSSIGLPMDKIIDWAIIIGALVVALIVAKIIAWLVGKGIKKANFIKTTFNKIGVNLDMDLIWNILSKFVYFIILFAVFVWVLKYVNVEIKLVNDILDNYLPKFINAAILAVIAWFLATIAKTAIIKGSQKADLAKKIGGDANMSESVWIVAYWAIIVYFLPEILKKLGQDELLKPLTNIIDNITAYIPNLIGAAIIFIIWLFIAKIVKQIVTNLLASTWADKAAEKFGLKDFSISSLAWTIVYILILLPIAIQALDKLEIEVISGPATNILQTMMDSIPKILTATIIIWVFYFVGKFVSKLVAELLSWIGFDKILNSIGLEKVETKTKASNIVGTIIFIYIMFLAIIQATTVIDFWNISEIVTQIMAFSTNILIWIIILAIGMYLGNLASKIIKSATNSKVLPMVAKTWIIILTTFMALQQMQIGGEIVNQAFTLLLGAVAVAFALAVGLGSKEVAWEEVKKLIENMKK